MNSSLDLILDQALDEFEAQDLAEKTAANAALLHSDADDKETHYDHDKAERHMQLEDMMKSLQNPEYGQTLQSTLLSMSQNKEGFESVESLFQQIGMPFENQFETTYLPNDPDNPQEIEGTNREVAATLQKLAESQKGMEGFEAGKLEEAGEAMMDDMMAQFENLAEKEDYNDVIDGVMRQLLSKDLMYEPVKMVCEKFPEWLATHKASLTASEYTNYGLMYQTFQKLQTLFECEPDNFPRLTELMFEMQSYGQPPAELISQLAPGLQFDENGMPIMPNMGAGVMPGGEGLPDLGNLAGNMAEGQCCLS